MRRSKHRSTAIRTIIGVLFILTLTSCLLRPVGSNNQYGDNWLSVQIQSDNGHIEGHSVDLVRDLELVDRKVTDAHGRVVFADIEPGPYTLRLNSYWYPTVTRDVEVSAGENGAIVLLEAQGLTFAADWDASSAVATFSVTGDVQPLSQEMEIVSPGIVGFGAAKTTGLYSFPNASDVINTEEGTIDFWTVIPSGYGFILRTIADQNGISVNVSSDRLEFQVFWQSVDGQLNMMDFARMWTDGYHDQVHHITLTWKSCESSMRIYVDGKEMDVVRQRRITSQGSHEFVTPEGAMEFKGVGPFIALGSRPSGDSGADQYPTLYDQLSIRSIALSPEEIARDDARKREFLK